MKQVIVMRTDLPGMATGKMCAQAAHAAMGAVLPYLLPPWDDNHKHEIVLKWLAQAFTKVVLRIDSLEKLEAIYDEAKEADLIACLITDSGRSVFKGEPTITCCAIGPDKIEKIDAITGGLRPL